MRYLHTMLRVRDLDAALDFFCGALGLVELRRGDAQVQGDAIDTVVTGPVGQTVHVAEPSLQGDEAAVVRARQGMGAGDRVGVAVDGEDDAGRAVQNGAGVAADSEGTVEMAFAGFGGEGVHHLL